MPKTSGQTPSTRLAMAALAGGLVVSSALAFAQTAAASRRFETAAVRVTGSRSPARSAVGRVVTASLDHSATGIVPAPAGSYTGRTKGTDDKLTLYVSSNGKAVQDVSVPRDTLTCAPGASQVSYPFAVASAAISASGSFRATTSHRGVVDGYRATFTYVLRGAFSELRARATPVVSGTVRETIALTSGPALSCTSGAQSWSATRNAQPAPSKGPPPAGSYAGTTLENGDPLTFYVSAKRTSLQDVSVPYLGLDCAPGGAVFTDHLPIASVAVSSNGSFDATATQSGVFDGQLARFTYTFRGDFHGIGHSGRARAAGVFDETVTSAASQALNCASNDQPWYAARSRQPAETSSPPPDGNYAGTNPQNNEPVTFSVAAGATSLEDIAIPDLSLTCAPGGSSFIDNLSILSTPLGADGSFSATSIGGGTYDGSPATYTYRFLGSFHGADRSGAERVAGIFSMTIVSRGASPTTCASDEQSWSATS